MRRCEARFLLRMVPRFSLIAENVSIRQLP